MKDEIQKRLKKTVTGEKPDKIVTKLSDKDIQEEAFVLFGRFNPPTIAHQKIVENYSDRNLHVYLSHSFDDRNPIPYDRKLELCTEAFGSDFVVESNARNPFEALVELNENYSKVSVLCGSDRLEEFKNRLDKYNGKLYHYESITVECVGSREDFPISSSIIRESYRNGTDLSSYLAENIRKYEDEIRSWILKEEPSPIPQETDRVKFMRDMFFKNGRFQVPHRYKMQMQALDDTGGNNDEYA